MKNLFGIELPEHIHGVNSEGYAQYISCPECLRHQALYEGRDIEYYTEQLREIKSPFELIGLGLSDEQKKAVFS